MRTRCICKRVGRARLQGLFLRGPLGDAKAWLHVRADVSVFNMDDIIIVPVNNWGFKLHYETRGMACLC